MAKKKKGKPHSKNSDQFYVKGMHCASCEVLIEKKLLAIDGIRFADASLGQGTVEVQYDTNKRPTLKHLNDAIKEHGYVLSHHKTTEKRKKHKAKIIALSLGVLVLFVVFEKLQLGRFVSVDATSALPAFFALGLVAGLSSCAALIGGLLLSMIKQWNEKYIDAATNKEKAQPHVLFHVGRIIAFIVLGGGLGFVGQAISWNNATVFSVLTILVSIVMLILALQMLDAQWAQRLLLSAPKVVTRFAAREDQVSSKYMPFVIGALTFFLPCGFTLLAQTVALASGSVWRGAFVMGFFALGTLPVLAAISLGGLSWNNKPHKTAVFNKVAGIVVIFFVLYNVNGQMNVLSLPSLSDILPAPSATTNTGSTTGDGGQQALSSEQEIGIIAKGFSYIPTGATTLEAGKEATLIVDNQGIQGCGAFIAARGLIKNYVALEPGINEIELGKVKKGTYKLTCSMGMVPPVTITVR